MRKFLTVVFLLALSTCVFAEEGVKIGFVDMQQALNESASGKKAKAELEALVKARQVKIDEKIALRDKLVAEVEKQAVVLSEEARRQKEDELESLTREVERAVSDSNAELQKSQRELELSIVKDMDRIISDIGKSGGYTVILPSDILLYSKEGIDITDQVIQKLDDIAKSKAKEAPKKK